MKARWLLSFCLVVSLIGGTGRAADTETWVRVDTPHFTLLSDTSEAATVALGTHLERLRAVIAQLVPQTGLKAPVPTRFFVFHDEAAFQPYKLLVGGRPVDDAGYLVRHEHGNYAALVAGQTSSAIRLVYKQYLHFLLQSNFPELPQWLRQGVAELYSTFTSDSAEARIGLPVEDHVFWLRMPGRQLIPLAEFFAMDEAPLGGEEQADFFTQSRALAHYLILGTEEYRREVGGYLIRLINGESPERAIREAFGVDFATLEKELAAYIRQDTFSYVRLPIDDLADVQIESTVMSRAEVLWSLGDLLAHAVPERRAQAEAHFRAALEAEPAHGRASPGRNRPSSEASSSDPCLRRLGHSSASRTV
ncbi:MAG: hypothetical protein V3S30_01870 [Thermoanaerobaculia bacterium]